MGKTIPEEMKDIFSEIKEEGYITAVVILTNDGLRAGSCDYFDENLQLADTYAALISPLMDAAEKVRKITKNADETSRICLDIGSEDQDESIHLIIEKINDDYMLLAEYRWENSERLGDAYHTINHYVPQLKNILER